MLKLCPNCGTKLLFVNGKINSYQDHNGNAITECPKCSKDLTKPEPIRP